MSRFRKLSQTLWHCQYHIVWCLEYGFRVLEGEIKEGWVNPGWASDVADRCKQLYKNGQYEQAFPVCRKAAEQGNPRAQFILGKMYYFGKGVQQDDTEVVKWYYKAGLSYLKEGKKDDALGCVERIKDLKTMLHLSVPNAFLADKLLATIYGGGVPDTLPAPEKSQK